MDNNFLRNIAELENYLDIQIDYKPTNKNLLIVDRGTIDPMIRSSLVAQILNEKQNFDPTVLSVYNNNSWRHSVYKSFGIKKFVLTPRLKFSFFFIPSYCLSHYYFLFLIT